MTTIKETKQALAKYLIDYILYNNDTISTIVPDENFGNKKEMEKVYKAIDRVADLLEKL